MNPLPFAERLPNELLNIVSKRAHQRYLDHMKLVRARADRAFAFLIVVECLAHVIAATWNRTLAADSDTSSIQFYVDDSIIIAGLISVPVVMLVWKQAGAVMNQYLIGIAQVLTVELLLDVTNPSEGPFHVFGLLAFSALYRNWRVLILPTVVVALKYLIRGIVYPESVLSFEIPENWYEIKEMGWLLFEDAILFLVCLHAQREMRQLAYLSVAKDVVDNEVRRHMFELASSERQLRVSELRIRKIIETAYDAFIVTNTKGRILEWSVRAESLFGWATHEVLGKNILHVLGVFELSNQLSEAAATAMVRAQSGERLETTAKHRNGEQMAIEASVSAMVFNHEITLNIFFHDISVRKAMQTNLLHAQKMQGIGQLAAGIAHEINTPTQYANDNMLFLLDSFREIDNVLSFVEHQRSDDAAFDWESFDELSKSADLSYLRQEIPVAIEQAMDGVQRIAEITMAMKEFSHPGTPTKEVVDPRRIIQSSTTVCRNEWKYVADLQTEFDAELTALPCLPSELSQVLVILIVNAAQAISESRVANSNRLGTILIQTKRLEEWAEISVHDDGPGIPQENLERIFEPFFTTKEVGKGTGQGLAIAHAVIVEKHGGSISVTSRLGKGTTFTLRLPLGKHRYIERPSDTIELINS